MPSASVIADLQFRSGTLEVRGPQAQSSAPPGWAWDPRSLCFRAPAWLHGASTEALAAWGVPTNQLAKPGHAIELRRCARRKLYPHQTEALAAWQKAESRGIVVLPTGAGKTEVGLGALEALATTALVVAPTLDLVHQWYERIRLAFAIEPGIIGGGDYQVADVTVTTYDSACRHMEHLGHRFGLLVFDECHHLPSSRYQLAAECATAHARLGLTATPERADGADSQLRQLLGPIVYRQEIGALGGDFLAPYRIESVAVSLDDDERDCYERERAIYLGYLRRQGIRMSGPAGFRDFVMRSAATAEGQRAMQAYRHQRQLAFSAPSKLLHLDRLLALHRNDTALVFTQDNQTVYDISRRFLIPAITHQTKVSERAAILAGLRDGTYAAVVTSKVLNEGVDVPEANVAIVLSGSGSVREHVQRLGRVLRRQPGKQAILYELVSSGTNEEGVSGRRRDHVAYR